jgi:hypothetical protein
MKPTRLQYRVDEILQVRTCVHCRGPCTVVLFLSGAVTLFSCFKEEHDLVLTLQHLEKAHADCV